MYADAPHPWSITTGLPLCGPLSTTRKRTPVESFTYRAEMSGTPAGNTSAGESRWLTTNDNGRRYAALPNGKFPAAHHRKGPSAQPSNESEPERHVRPTLVAAQMILERVHRPEERIGASRRTHSLVRMPDAFGISIVEETLEQLRPVVILS